MSALAPVELKLLAAAVVIGLVQIVWAAAAGSGGDRSFPYLAGPRDEPRPLNVVGGRLDRALRNFLETFPLFAAAVLAVVVAGKTGQLTLWGCALYVIGRALYAPIYAAGVPVVRTLVWGVSMVGIVLVVIAFFG